MKSQPMNRRSFVKLGLQGLAASSAAAAWGQRPSNMPRYERNPLDEGDPNTFVFARFKFKGHQRTDDEWDVLPVGDENILRHVAGVTNIKLSKRTWKERVVEIDDFAKLYTTPFLFMTGQVDFHFEPDEAQALAEYFKRGGFIYADDCDADIDRMLFYEAYVREMEKIFPGHNVKPLPYDHDLFHCFYDIPDGSPWYRGEESLKARYPDAALFYKDRMVTFLTGSDVHCRWALRRRDNHQESLEMGTNIIVYALTH